MSAPRRLAFTLIRTTALDEAAHHALGGDRPPPPPNWEMYGSLTAALENWHAAGSLRQNSLLLVEWLAVDLVAYLTQQFGDQGAVEQWLRDFRKQVRQAQQHDHPAGLTALAAVEAVADDLNGDPPGRLTRIGASYLLYLRDVREVEDAREVALTLALWAGSHLAALMLHDAERIAAFMDARDQPEDAVGVR